MGFCVYFHRTWTPGFNSEYIDPNLAYKFQRKLQLAKKVAWWMFVLTLMACVILLLVKLYTNKNPYPGQGRTTREESSTDRLHSVESDRLHSIQNTDETDRLESSLLDAESDRLHSTPDAESDRLHSTPGAESDRLHSTPDAESDELASTTTLDSESDELESTLDTPSDSVFDAPSDPDRQFTSTIGTECGFRCNSTQKCIPLERKCDGRFDCTEQSGSYNNGMESNNIDRSDELDCPCLPESFVCDKNSTECIHMSLVCDSLADCSNKKDEATCTAISEGLTKVSAIDKRKKEIKGYVLVRVRGSWHPYCKKDWSTDLGRKICKFFDYKRLVELQTIELTDLNRRIGVNLTGRGRSSEEIDSTPTEKSKLLVFNATENYKVVTGGSIHDVVTEAADEDEYDCTVGHIFCSQ